MISMHGQCSQNNFANKLEIITPQLVMEFLLVLKMVDL